MDVQGALSDNSMVYSKGTLHVEILSVYVKFTVVPIVVYNPTPVVLLFTVYVAAADGRAGKCIAFQLSIAEPTVTLLTERYMVFNVSLVLPLSASPVQPEYDLT